MTKNIAETAPDTPVRMGRPGVAGPARDRFGLTGVAKSYDPRIVAIRPDLADIAVAGTHFAPHYAAPMMRSCIVPAAPIRKAASSDAEQISELLFGEGFALLDLTGGWAWGYCLADHYVGYLAADALGNPIAPSHRIRFPQAIVHSAADAGSNSQATLPGGALVMGCAQGDWVETAQGFLAETDVESLESIHPDPVALAETLIGTPYGWGGRSVAGVDCSGLMQIIWNAAGVQLPRDSDLQLAALDQHVAPDALRRGDMVFFPGHVGIMADPETIIHASRRWMAVKAEPLADVIARSAAKGHEPPVAGYRRVC